MSCRPINALALLVPLFLSSAPIVAAPATLPASPPLTLLPVGPAPAAAPDRPATRPTTRPARVAVTFSGTRLSLPTPLIIVRYSTRLPDSVTAARQPPRPVEVELTVPGAERERETRTFATVVAPPDVVKGEDKWAKLIVNGRNTPLDGRVTAIEFPRSTAMDSGGDVALYVSTPVVSVTWPESAPRLRVRRWLAEVAPGSEVGQRVLATAAARALEGTALAETLVEARERLLAMSDLELLRTVVSADPARVESARTPAELFRESLLLEAALTAVAPTGTLPQGATLRQFPLEGGRTLLVFLPASTPNSRRLVAGITLFDAAGQTEAAFTLAFAPGQATPETLMSEVIRILSGD